MVLIGGSQTKEGEGRVQKPLFNNHSTNAICNQRFKNRIELRTLTQPLIAKHIGETIRAQNDPSRNRRTNEVAFIAGCSHFTRKNTRFRAPASSPTHSPCNIMQQFQCNLQPEIQEPHRTTHADTTTRCKTHRRNKSRTKRPQPQPPHRRGSFQQPAAATLHGKTQGFVLRLPPQHTAHATSCSNSNAICNQRFKNRIEQRTLTQPLIAKHIGGTIRAQNDPSRNRRTNEVAFIAGCRHFTRKNTRFRAPASSPKHSPCNMHASPLPIVSTSLCHHFHPSSRSTP